MTFFVGYLNRGLLSFRLRGRDLSVCYSLKQGTSDNRCCGVGSGVDQLPGTKITMRFQLFSGKGCEELPSASMERRLAEIP